MGSQEGYIFVYTKDEEAGKPSTTGKGLNIVELGRVSKFGTVMGEFL